MRAWVTGASSGIGEALVRELARRNARVAVFARRGERLEALARELAPAGILVQEGDVTDRARVRAAVAEAEERFGGLDLAVLNAGIGDSFDPEHFDTELVERIFRVNFFGAVYGVEACLPGMLARGAGTIAGISSLAALRGMPTAAPYCASKSALTTFLEGLRLECAPRGVEITVIAPGFVKTPLTDRNRHPMPLLLPADAAARKILRALERKKPFYAFPARLYAAMWMLRLLPTRVVDALLARFVVRHARPKLPE